MPPFARVPYEPFSRDAAVAIALREWRAFGSPVDDSLPDREHPVVPEVKPEREQGLWQRIGEYWWIALDAGSPESGWTGRHDAEGRVFPPDDDGRFAWSAAFVSYVMREAGARDGFPYSASHWEYVDAAFAQEPGVLLRTEVVCSLVAPAISAARSSLSMRVASLSRPEVSSGTMMRAEFAGSLDLTRL